MRIGELEAATGVSARTLRFWEAEGLLPDPGRTPAGYRDYPPEAADRVRFVRRAQTAGLTLAQVRSVLRVSDEGQAPCGHVAAFVDERLAEVDARLAELGQVRGQLAELRGRLNVLDRAECETSRGVCVAIDGQAAGTTAS